MTAPPSAVFFHSDIGFQSHRTWLLITPGWVSSGKFALQNDFDNLQRRCIRKVSIRIANSPRNRRMYRDLRWSATVHATTRFIFFIHLESGRPPVHDYNSGYICLFVFLCVAYRSRNAYFPIFWQRATWNYQKGEPDLRSAVRTRKTRSYGKHVATVWTLTSRLLFTTLDQRN